MPKGNEMAHQDQLKQWVGEAAAQEIRDGMHVGIGTGSTAEAFIHALASRIQKGLDIKAVATSQRSHDLCCQLGFDMGTLADIGPLDVTVDGADEIDPSFHLIKGGGGAHLREKIVASASHRLVIIADNSKLVPQLGQFPLPVEMIAFEATYTARMIQSMLCELLDVDVQAKQRFVGDAPFVTDSGNWIWDFHCQRITDPETLALALDTVPGVVEHGLFVGMADLVLVAGPEGVERMEKGGDDEAL